MATRYLIMLAADAVALLPTKRFKNKLLRLGRPVVERAGVANRRVLWAHDFPTDLVNGTLSFEFDDENVTMLLTPTFPANWRPRLNPFD